MENITYPPDTRFKLQEILQNLLLEYKTLWSNFERSVVDITINMSQSEDGDDIDSHVSAIMIKLQQIANAVYMAHQLGIINDLERTMIFKFLHRSKIKFEGDIPYNPNIQILPPFDPKDLNPGE